MIKLYSPQSSHRIILISSLLIIIIVINHFIINACCLLRSSLSLYSKEQKRREEGECRELHWLLPGFRKQQQVYTTEYVFLKAQKGSHDRIQTCSYLSSLQRCANEMRQELPSLQALQPLGFGVRGVRTIQGQKKGNWVLSAYRNK